MPLRKHFVQIRIENPKGLWACPQESYLSSSEPNTSYNPVKLSFRASLLIHSNKLPKIREADPGDLGGLPQKHYNIV